MQARLAKHKQKTEVHSTLLHLKHVWYQHNQNATTSWCGHRIATIFPHIIFPPDISHFS